MHCLLLTLYTQLDRIIQSNCWSTTMYRAAGGHVQDPWAPRGGRTIQAIGQQPKGTLSECRVTQIKCARMVVGNGSITNIF